jgi:hypothetical protein
MIEDWDDGHLLICIKTIYEDRKMVNVCNCSACRQERAFKISEDFPCASIDEEEES